MKIILVGKGYRIVHLLDGLPARAREITVITGDERTLREMVGKRVTRVSSDPASVVFEAQRLSPGPEDIILVVDHEEPSLRATLENLRRQKLPGMIVIFTPLATRDLRRDFPEYYFKSDRSVYTYELREIMRRAGTQMRVQAIRRIVREAPRTVVAIWGNPDPDALASAFALGELLQQDARDFVISYLGEFTRPENSAMVRMIRIPTVKYAPELVTPGAVVATVDAQPSFYAPGQIRFDIIIDHHPLMELGPHRYADVRPTYGATSTILTEYFIDSGTRMSKRAATALFYGLKVDTGSLTRNVSDADVSAFKFLRQHADENMVRTIELSQLPISTLDHFGVALSNRKIMRDVMFSYLGTVDNPDVCVHVADFFIKISGISWAVVACRSGGRVIVVFRSDGFRKHAGVLAERLFLDYGSAGGHRTMARAEIAAERLQSEVPDTPDVGVERWLLKRLATGLRSLKHATEA